MGIYYPFLGGGRTCNQIATPLVYDESLSVEQQIARLFGKIAIIDSDFVTTVEFDDFKSQIHAEQVAQTEQLEGYTDSEIAKLDKELRDLIAGSQVGMLIWNVTVGACTGNVKAMRDFFNDVAVHAITVDTLAQLDLTVDQLAECGLNVRGLAVFSGYLMGDDFVPEGIAYDGAPPLDGKLTCSILANGEVRDGYFVEGSE
jgi:hypothetical protein